MKRSFNRTLSIVLSILMLVLSLPMSFVFADVVQVGAQMVENYYGTDFSYKTSYNGKNYDLYITDYTGTATDLVIPTNIWDHPVKGISDYAFSSCKNLVSVTIPEGVESVSNGAFSNCTGLKSITIPSSVTAMRAGAFSGCTSLTNVYISDVAAWCNVDFGNNYDSNPLYHATKLYVNNSLVTSVNIPSGVTSIPSRAFSCENITSITIPSTVTSINKNAFSYCKNLKSITIPSSVTEIGSEAFYACDSLKNITVPASVQSIGDNAFLCCNSLEAINVNSSNSSYASDSGVLYNKDMTTLLCYPMNKYDTSFEVPEGVQTIGKYAFYNNRKLQSILISEGVTKILSNAFEHTFSLKDVTIPKSLIRVDSDAFKDCQNMENVYINDIAAWCGITYGSGSSNPLIRAKDLYIDNELVGDVIIPEGVESIADYAFSGTSVTSVTFPESLKKLGKNCFYACYSLKNIEIPDGVATIPSYAFAYCTLEGITVPQSVTKIENNAFYTTKIDYVSYCGTVEEWNVINIGSGNDVLKNSICYETKYITVSNGIKYRVSVNNEAEVLECSGENTQIVIPDDIDGYPVKVIKAEAFAENKIIESLLVSEGIETIEEKAFADCTNLASISIPQSIISIGKGAFQNCSSLAQISIPDSVKSIGPSAFYGTGYYNDKSNWTDGVLYIDNILIKSEKAVEGIYEIKPGTRVIADEAFMWTWIEGVIIPSSLTNIGTDAFLNCESLDSVYITDISAWCKVGAPNAKGHPLYWADELYINDELISELVIPNDVTYVPAYAFSCTNITSLTIPSSVTEMENYAFYGCKYLKELSTGYVGDFLCRDVLGGCGNLVSVIISEGVTRIGENAFAGCSKLTSVTIPDTVTSIGDDAFSGCSGLTSIEIPEDAIYIGDGAFSGCSGLISIDIPKGVTCIGSYTFSGCSGLTSIDIPDKVTSIGDCAFMNCTGLTSVVISEGVTLVDNNAFSGCTNLLWVLIPESVTDFGWYIFEECTSFWHILYGGTQEQWNGISISYYDNEILMTTERHYGATADDITEISKDETCTEDGFEGICCTICKDEKYTSTTKTTGHSFDNGICTVCGGYLESDHPYQNSMYKSWTIYHENAESISITFSEDTFLDWDNDYIYIYDSNDNVIGSYSGDTLAKQTITVNGDKLTILMDTNSYRGDYGFRIVDIAVKEKQPPVFTDEDTNITVEVTEGETEGDMQLVAEEVTDQEQIDEIDLVLGGKVLGKLYDITLQKDGTVIQLSGKVQVRIPVENETSEIFRVEEDGSVTNMNAVYKEGYLVFTTDHFSLYAIVTSETASLYELGDVNLDGVVNVRDATTIQKWVASIIVLSDEALAVADVNDDSSINVKDATMIQKRIAGLV